MKKIIIILCLIIMMTMLSGCGRQAAQESDYGGFFITVADYGSHVDVYTKFFYDPITRVVYFRTNTGVSPYYIVKFGKAEVALYGINWTESDLP